MPESFRGFDNYKPTQETLRPDIYFTEEEEEQNTRFRSKFLGKKIIVWGLSGSALHKSYPYTHMVMSEILDKYPDVVFITIGDDKCEILEQALRHERVIHKSNKWSFREAMCMVKHAYALVCPDTGILHSSGAWDKPKIGLLTCTSITNITKYFTNDYSLEADVPCAPCYRLIYSADMQCPVDKDKNGEGLCAPFCNAYGISPITISDIIKHIFTKDRKERYEQAKKELIDA